MTTSKMDLSVAREIAMARVAEAGMGDVARMLRAFDPDGDWPRGDLAFREHCRTIVIAGIVDGGPESCDVFATLIVMTAEETAVAAYMDEFMGDDDSEDATITSLAEALEEGLCTAQMARGMFPMRGAS